MTKVFFLKTKKVESGGQRTESGSGEQLLPKLSDSQIETLWEKMIKIDSKYKDFKGTKREYCSKVNNLISNFVYKNSDKKSGEGKFAKKRLADQEKKEKIILDDIQKIDLLKYNIKKKFFEEKYEKERDDIKDEIKELRGKVDETLRTKKGDQLFSSKHFEEDEEDDSDDDEKVVGRPKMVDGKYNPFAYKTGLIIKESDKTVLDFNDISYSAVYSNIFLYSDIIENLNTKDYKLIAPQNFIIASVFPNISDATPTGYTQRTEFLNYLTSINRHLKPKNAVAVWGESDEATFIDEKIIHDMLIVDTWNLPPLSKNSNFALLGKIFSNEISFERVDFKTRWYIFESKGNATSKDVGSSRSPTGQVNFDKIGQVLLDSLYSHNKPPQTEEQKIAWILFNGIRNYQNVIKYKQNGIDYIAGLNVRKMFKEYLDFNTIIINKPKGKALKETREDVEERRKLNIKIILKTLEVYNSLDVENVSADAKKGNSLATGTGLNKKEKANYKLFDLAIKDIVKSYFNFEEGTIQGIVASPGATLFNIPFENSLVDSKIKLLAYNKQAFTGPDFIKISELAAKYDKGRVRRIEDYEDISKFDFNTFQLEEEEAVSAKKPVEEEEAVAAKKPVEESEESEEEPPPTKGKEKKSLKKAFLKS